jgi:hypothetical protein
MNVLGIILARRAQPWAEEQASVAPSRATGDLRTRSIMQRRPQTLTSVVVTSDCQEHPAPRRRAGFHVVARPPELATADCVGAGHDAACISIRRRCKPKAPFGRGW